jgi:hypothetical protein
LTETIFSSTASSRQACSVPRMMAADFFESFATSADARAYTWARASSRTLRSRRSGRACFSIAQV